MARILTVFYGFNRIVVVTEQPHDSAVLMLCSAGLWYRAQGLPLRLEHGRTDQHSLTAFSQLTHALLLLCRAWLGAEQRDRLCSLDQTV